VTSSHPPLGSSDPHTKEWREAKAREIQYRIHVETDPEKLGALEYALNKRLRVNFKLAEQEQLEKDADDDPKGMVPLSPFRGQLLHKLCFNFRDNPHNTTEAHYSFMPDPAKGRPGACQDPDAEKLRAFLLKLAHPSSCAPKGQVLTEGPTIGVGGMMTSWLRPYMYAVEHKYSMWSPLLKGYADTKPSLLPTSWPRCPMTTMACFFKPLSSCEHGEEGQFWRTVKDLPHHKFCSKYDCFSGFRSRRALDSYSPTILRGQGTYFDAAGLPTNVPAEWRRMGFFRYASELFRFMLREPSDYFRGVMERAKLDAGWGGGGSVERPLLSMHVRHGDTCIRHLGAETARKCDPLSKYMKRAVLPMDKKYGIKSIFVATDDENVTKEGPQRWPQFQWLFVKTQDRGQVKAARRWEENMAMGLFDPFNEAQEVLIDLLLMAEGDAFVGKFTSNIDRLAYSLLATRVQGLAPFYSLDGSAWCADWGQLGGKSSFGLFKC